MTVGISIGIVILLIGSSMYGNRVSFGKNTKMLLLIQILKALETLMTGYLIAEITDMDYFILYEIIVVALLLIPMIVTRYYPFLKKT